MQQSEGERSEGASSGRNESGAGADGGEVWAEAVGGRRRGLTMAANPSAGRGLGWGGGGKDGEEASFRGFIGIYGPWAARSVPGQFWPLGSRIIWARKACFGN